jgi:hypothetical protein
MHWGGGYSGPETGERRIVSDTAVRLLCQPPVDRQILEVDHLGLGRVAGGQSPSAAFRVSIPQGHSKNIRDRFIEIIETEDPGLADSARGL